MKNDIFQKRYIEHQEKKKRMIEIKKFEQFVKKTEFDIKKFILLKDFIFRRRSQRLFNKEKILDYEWNAINFATIHAPSSCNRQAIYIQKISPKSFFPYLLVGGTNWIKNAKSIIFFYADMNAYKSPNEIDFMPYLDTGFVAQNIYLICESLGMGCCFVNPNVKIKGHLDRNNFKFTGAMAIGHYDNKAPMPQKRTKAWKNIIG